MRRKTQMLSERCSVLFLGLLSSDSCIDPRPGSSSALPFLIHPVKIVWFELVDRECELGEHEAKDAETHQKIPEFHWVFRWLPHHELVILVTRDVELMWRPSWANEPSSVGAVGLLASTSSHVSMDREPTAAVDVELVDELVEASRLGKEARPAEAAFVGHHPAHVAEV
eukprot:CAMPEP_0194511048 /NCGR_PEP_ID=MMETSP0253-20130528/42596_1 /TAXON_ID=2966 /ORGANISM="Noctiluca scintillans" /LENGTH=168 /DNA_ID=CAMNT_0039354353 /DNA_START=27 /DNA_END=532 /DNA_ORIENTATION=-